MYYDDHSPPHFHVYYGEHAAKIEITSLRLIAGSLPRRALSMVLEWATDHRDELMVNWRLAEAHQPLSSIKPLE